MRYPLRQQRGRRQPLGKPPAAIAPDPLSAGRRVAHRAGFPSAHYPSAMLTLRRGAVKGWQAGGGSLPSLSASEAGRSLTPPAVTTRRGAGAGVGRGRCRSVAAKSLGLLFLFLAVLTTGMVRFADRVSAADVQVAAASASRLLYTAPDTAKPAHDAAASASSSPLPGRTAGVPLAGLRLQRRVLPMLARNPLSEPLHMPVRGEPEPLRPRSQRWKSVSCVGGHLSRTLL